MNLLKSTILCSSKCWITLPLSTQGPSPLDHIPTDQTIIFNDLEQVKCHASEMLTVAAAAIGRGCSASNKGDIESSSSSSSSSMGIFDNRTMTSCGNWHGNPRGTPPPTHIQNGVQKWQFREKYIMTLETMWTWEGWIPGWGKVWRHGWFGVLEPTWYTIAKLYP